MPVSANNQDVRRLVGIANYLQKLAPNLADTTAPLRELIKESNMFQWNEQVEGQCLERIKKTLATGPAPKFFDPHQPVVYALRSLTETEQQYAQIEKEMFAIVFGTERFEQYVYGHKVRVETDHKPLESIVKSILSAPKRLQ